MTTREGIRAVRLRAPDRFEIVDRPSPDQAPGMTLVAPAYVGLCGTDLDLIDGSMPYLHQGFASYPLQPGHEWSGTLLEPAGEMPAGTRVVLDPIVDCGRQPCADCDAGRVARCGRRREFGVRNGLDGALATVVAAPSGNLLPVPDGVSLRSAALVEPMVTTLEGIGRVEPRLGEEVLIVGAGTLGLVGAMVLVARGIRPYVLLRSPSRAPTVEAAGAIPWLAGTRAAVERFDVVIEAAGTPGPVQASISLVASGGRVALLGVPTMPVEIDAAAIVVNDIIIRGVLNGPGQYPSALAALASGQVIEDLLIDRVYPFDEIASAVARAREPGRARPKVLVQLAGERPAVSA